MTIRRPIRAGLAGLLLAAGVPAVAQPSRATAPATPGVPIVPARPRPGLPSVSAVRAVDAAVRIDGAVATTTLRIAVFNPGRATAEGSVLVPVPPGSSIRSFGIDGVGDEPTAELLPREEATRRYREIVARMVDPGLLEFVGTDLIQSSVFPIRPGAERVVTVVYEHAMPAHAGQVEYVLPRSTSAGDGAAWTVTVEVERKGGGPVFSPTHPIATREEPGKVVVTVPSMSEPGPFRLYAADGRGDGRAACLLYPESEHAGYFMFVADAPEPAGEPMPRSVTIVLDRSGSMAGAKIEQAKESVRQVLAGLRPGEPFNIIDYASDVRVFAEAPVPMSDETRARALAYVDAIQARGGTNLHDALVEALRSPLPDGHLGMVLFLTDGQPTTGVTAEPDIRRAARQRNAAGRRVFTFGVGLDVNAPLLDALAADTRAESAFVLPGESVELKVAQVFDKLDGPVMIDPVFAAQPSEADGPVKVFDLEPRVVPDLFRGSRVMVVGRYEGSGSATIGLSSDADAEPGLTAVLRAADASARHGFVARLWAQKRIDALLAAIRAAAADGSAPSTELVDEIVRLSLEHGIMTEYTAFLAAEDLGLADAVAPTRDDGSVGFGYSAARETVARRAAERSGSSGVSQSVNRKDLAAERVRGQVAATDGRVESFAPKANVYYDADMQLQTVATVQRSLGGTLYRKAGRWEDARLGEHADGTPDLVVEFATDDYWALADDLATQGRQWMLANRGEVYLVNHGQRVLVRNPS